MMLVFAHMNTWMIQVMHLKGVVGGFSKQIRMSIRGKIVVPHDEHFGANSIQADDIPSF